MLGGIGFGVLSPENDTRQQVSGVYQQHLSTIIEKYSQTLTLLHKFRKLASARRKHLSIKLTNCRFKALRWKKTHAPTQCQLCFDLLVALYRAWIVRFSFFAKKSIIPNINQNTFWVRFSFSRWANIFRSHLLLLLLAVNRRIPDSPMCYRFVYNSLKFTLRLSMLQNLVLCFFLSKNHFITNTPGFFSINFKINKPHRNKSKTVDNNQNFDFSIKIQLSKCFSFHNSYLIAFESLCNAIWSMLA